MVKLKCGVIGYGRLGAWHARNIMRNVHAELCAVADSFDDALVKAEKETGVEKLYRDYRDLLEDSDIKGVVIASSTKYHFGMLMDAVDAGKSIFVEKPITYTVEEADAICAAIEKSGLYLQVGYMRRFDPGHVAAKNMIESGEIGDPLYIHDCQRDPNGPPPAYVPESGGLFVDMGIHDLDVARWLMGSEITQIYAQGAVLKHTYLNDLNDVDEGQMMLKFASGALGDIEISRNANDIYDTRTEIVGTKSSVFVGQTQLTPYIKVGKNGFQFDAANWCLGRFEKGYEREIEAFIENVNNDRESPVPATDGRAGLKLAKIATQSYQEGAAIKIDL
jgi:inositol 2-dehydrogenase